jgi:hypothetical protein
MRSIYRRSFLIAAVAAALIPSSALLAADKPSELRIDWATDNPVSMLLKDKGWFEKGIRKRRHQDALGVGAWLQQGAGIPQRRLDRLRFHRRRGAVVGHDVAASCPATRVRPSAGPSASLCQASTSM